MFRLVKIQNGRCNQPEPQKLGVTASETYTLGEALVLTAGALTKCGATAKPTYIAGEDYTAPESGARRLTVYPVSGDMISETAFTAAPTSLTDGSVVTLSADGLGVTATTTSGVATVVDLAGAAAVGDKVLVRF